MAQGIIEVRQLTEQDARSYRDIRLEGLERYPEAFGASFETEAAESLEFFANRVQTSVIFGGFNGADLLGIAGYYRESSEKERHKAMLFGMYVREIARRGGIGKMLVMAILHDARTQAESIRLTVEASNGAARRLYELCGFKAYGTEPRSLRVAEQYYDELLMYKNLTD